MPRRKIPRRSKPSTNIVNPDFDSTGLESGVIGSLGGPDGWERDRYANESDRAYFMAKQLVPHRIDDDNPIKSRHRGRVAMTASGYNNLIEMGEEVPSYMSIYDYGGTNRQQDNCTHTCNGVEVKVAPGTCIACKENAYCSDYWDCHDSWDGFIDTGWACCGCSADWGDNNGVPYGKKIGWGYLGWLGDGYCEDGYYAQSQYGCTKDGEDSCYCGSNPDGHNLNNWWRNGPCGESGTQSDTDPAVTCDGTHWFYWSNSQQVTAQSTGNCVGGGAVPIHTACGAWGWDCGDVIDPDYPCGEHYANTNDLPDSATDGTWTEDTTPDTFQHCNHLRGLTPTCNGKCNRHFYNNPSSEYYIPGGDPGGFAFTTNGVCYCDDKCPSCGCDPTLGYSLDVYHACIRNCCRSNGGTANQCDSGNHSTYSTYCAHPACEGIAGCETYGMGSEPGINCCTGDAIQSCGDCCPDWSDQCFLPAGELPCECYRKQTEVGSYNFWIDPNYQDCQWSDADCSFADVIPDVSCNVAEGCDDQCEAHCEQYGAATDTGEWQDIVRGADNHYCILWDFNENLYPDISWRNAPECFGEMQEARCINNSCYCDCSPCLAPNEGLWDFDAVPLVGCGGFGAFMLDGDIYNDDSNGALPACNYNEGYTGPIDAHHDGFQCSKQYLEDETCSWWRQVNNNWEYVTDSCQTYAIELGHGSTACKFSSVSYNGGTVGNALAGSMIGAEIIEIYTNLQEGGTSWFQKMQNGCAGCPDPFAGNYTGDVIQDGDGNPLGGNGVGCPYPDLGDWLSANQHSTVIDDYYGELACDTSMCYYEKGCAQGQNPGVAEDSENAMCCDPTDASCQWLSQDGGTCDNGCGISGQYVYCHAPNGCGVNVSGCCEMDVKCVCCDGTGYETGACNYDYLAVGSVDGGNFGISNNSINCTQDEINSGNCAVVCVGTGNAYYCNGEGDTTDTYCTYPTKYCNDCDGDGAPADCDGSLTPLAQRMNVCEMTDTGLGQDLWNYCQTATCYTDSTIPVGENGWPMVDCGIQFDEDEQCYTNETHDCPSAGNETDNATCCTSTLGCCGSDLIDDIDIETPCAGGCSDNSDKDEETCLASTDSDGFPLQFFPCCMEEDDCQQCVPIGMGLTRVEGYVWTEADKFAAGDESCQYPNTYNTIPTYYNTNDPACNPDLGGDPFSDACTNFCDCNSNWKLDCSCLNNPSEATCNGGLLNDCAGQCGGDAELDECDECNGPGTDEDGCCPGLEADCAGECGGIAIWVTVYKDSDGDTLCVETTSIDEFWCYHPDDNPNPPDGWRPAVDSGYPGACTGWEADNVDDCAGTEDCAGLCNGPGVVDCNGVCCESGFLDLCGDCDGYSTGKGEGMMDQCGLCGPGTCVGGNDGQVSAGWNTPFGDPLVLTWGSYGCTDEGDGTGYNRDWYALAGGTDTTSGADRSGLHSLGCNVRHCGCQCAGCINPMSPSWTPYAQYSSTCSQGEKDAGTCMDWMCEHQPRYNPDGTECNSDIQPDCGYCGMDTCEGEGFGQSLDTWRNCYKRFEQIAWLQDMYCDNGHFSGDPDYNNYWCWYGDTDNNGNDLYDIFLESQTYCHQWHGELKLMYCNNISLTASGYDDGGGWVDCVYPEGHPQAGSVIEPDSDCVRNHGEYCCGVGSHNHCRMGDRTEVIWLAQRDTGNHQYEFGDYSWDNDPGNPVGDINNDGIVNVIDVVQLVRYVLGDEELPPGWENLLAADISGDNTLNILDIVALVNIILGTMRSGGRINNSKFRSNGKLQTTTEAELIRVLKPLFGNSLNTQMKIMTNSNSNNERVIRHTKLLGWRQLNRGILQSYHEDGGTRSQYDIEFFSLVFNAPQCIPECGGSNCELTTGTINPWGGDQALVEIGDQFSSMTWGTERISVPYQDGTLLRAYITSATLSADVETPFTYHLMTVYHKNAHIQAYDSPDDVNKIIYEIPTGAGVCYPGIGESCDDDCNICVHPWELEGIYGVNVNRDYISTSYCYIDWYNEQCTTQHCGCVDTSSYWYPGEYSCGDDYPTMQQLEYEEGQDS